MDKHLTYNKVEQQQGTNVTLLFLSNFWICWNVTMQVVLSLKSAADWSSHPPSRWLSGRKEHLQDMYSRDLICPCINFFLTKNERTPMYKVYGFAPSGILAFILGWMVKELVEPQARLQDRTDGLRLALCAEQILLWGIPGASLRNLIPLVQAIGNVQKDWLLKGSHKCNNSICI